MTTKKPIKKDETKKEETKKVVKKIELMPLNIKTITINIIGKTPLLMDKMPQETLNNILAKQTGLSNTNKKKVRDTSNETSNAIHKTSMGKIGYPASAFKKAMIDATSRVGDKFFSKGLVMGAIRIINSVEGLVLLKYSKQSVLEHNVGSNVKFTPMFQDWSCELKIQFDANNITAEDILTLVNYAGFYVGIGSWRPKCRDGGSGEFGQFEIKMN